MFSKIFPEREKNKRENVFFSRRRSEKKNAKKLNGKIRG
jgi:hypothetical protein